MWYDQGIMSERRPPQEIADIVEAVSNRDPNLSILDAFTMIREAGFFGIGTTQSEAIHLPVANQTYADRKLGHRVYVEEPGVPVLQATWSGKLAVMCAIFGDINKSPSERRQIGALAPHKYSYGWYGHGKENLLSGYGDEGIIGTQADLELLNAVRRGHDTITGAIDFIESDDNFYIHPYKPEPEELHGPTRPGIVLTGREHATVATLPIFGSDLWATGIVPTTKIEH